MVYLSEQLATDIDITDKKEESLEDMRTYVMQKNDQTAGESALQMNIFDRIWKIKMSKYKRKQNCVMVRKRKYQEKYKRGVVMCVFIYTPPKYIIFLQNTFA